jgi:hypothetical protein
LVRFRTDLLQGNDYHRFAARVGTGEPRVETAELVAKTDWGKIQCFEIRRAQEGAAREHAKGETTGGREKDDGDDREEKVDGPAAFSAFVMTACTLKGP